MEENAHHFENMKRGAKKASQFVAWFVLITDIPTRLAYSGFGRGGLLQWLVEIWSLARANPYGQTVKA
jgi:hypothetical protein